MEPKMQTLRTQSLPASSTATTFAARTGIVLTATLFIALSAHLSVPLPFTPVPITFQTFAVLLAGLALGPRMGFLTLCAYLAEGAIGLPVFSPHSIGLAGPDAGYLISYPLAAFAAGAIAFALRNKIPAFAAATLAGIAAIAITFTLGATWIHLTLHLSSTALYATAVAPFLLGESLKIAAAASLYTGWQRWRSR
jgi:biotin transport system substrate-specific component